MTTMTRHNDNAGFSHAVEAVLLQYKNQRHYAEVPALALDQQSELIERVISFAFETLDARHVDVRVRAADA